jgi:hypothetical protein
MNDPHGQIFLLSLLSQACEGDVSQIRLAWIHCVSFQSDDLAAACI